MILELSKGHALTFEQIQKALFIVQHQMPDGVKNRPQFEYEPFHFGPHAPAVQENVTELVREKMAHVAPGRDGDKVYSITANGSKLAAAMHYDLGRDVIQYTERIIDWIRATPAEKVVLEIIKKYPEYQMQSAYRKAA